MRTRRILCSSVLVAEAFVLFFALLVAKDLTDVPGVVLAWGGGAAVLTCLLLPALLRYGWAYAVGSLLQVLLIVSGMLVPVMYALGAIFAGLWIVALVLARRLEGAAG